METTGGLAPVDYGLCVVYLIGIALLGGWFFRNQRSARDFFLAGRTMGWLPLGLSLMVTLASSIGFIGAPTAAIHSGIIMLWSLVAIPLTFPVVIWVFLPFYNRLQLYTAYEYLERRFDVRVRLFASGLFILWRITWMAATLYVPAMVFHVATGKAVPVATGVIVFGLVATAYTAVGGIRAVIWTDVAQFFVMFGGVAVALALIDRSVSGGAAAVWEAAQSAGKTHLTAPVPGWAAAGPWGKARLYLYTDFTVLAIMVSFTLDKLGNYCVDQAMVQRYFCAKSLRTARIGFALNCVAFALFFTLMTLAGIALIAFRAGHPVPESLRPDQVFPYFIAHYMPAGAAGLMLAAIMAAAMSSLDSGVNSCITAISNDFYNRLWRHRHNMDESVASEREALSQVWLARISTVVLGICVIVMACFIGRMGDVFQIALKLVNSFIGPLFGVFTLAMFTRRAHGLGVLLGALLGAALAALIVFADKLGPAFHVFDVGFMWVSALGFLTTYVLGYGLSLALPTPASNGVAWTFRAVMKR